jgi:hypothetical protein
MCGWGEVWPGGLHLERWNGGEGAVEVLRDRIAQQVGDVAVAMPCRATSYNTRDSLWSQSCGVLSVVRSEERGGKRTKEVGGLRRPSNETAQAVKTAQMVTSAEHTPLRSSYPAVSHLSYANLEESGRRAATAIAGRPCSLRLRVTVVGVVGVVEALKIWLRDRPASSLRGHGVRLLTREGSRCLRLVG